ncbi:MAG: motility associated factor glycosyltransferase family protein [Planctomycetes bacterium]|nr:motility associated factor glycosyltransferase family protein [Planctomycetota bacterium]
MGKQPDVTDRTAPTVGNEMFLVNMRALWRVDPDLAMRVDAVEDDERLPIEPTRSGAMTLRMKAPGGQSLYLHSRHDPDAEAKKLASAVSIDEGFCFVVMGLGLGFHVRALFDRLRGDAFIICTEPSIGLIATALTCVDLSESIRSGRLVILTDGDKSRLHARLQRHNAVMMLGAQFVRHAPSMRIAEDAHHAIGRAITEYVTYMRMSLMTLVGNSKITCKNIAMNLVNYVSTPPIDLLKERFLANPCVVVSAGPSLARNIDLLRELKGRAVLCAVQTALKPLMQHGIEPDFVTSLDFHEISKRFFEDAGDLRGVHLVAEPKATWHVLDEYQGPVSVLGSGFARLLIGDELGERASLKAGATVAHLAFYLAVYMGCDPIIFVGQDLAFTGHVFYVPGVEIHKSWRSEINRFNTMEMKEWERIVRNRPILRRCEDVFGRTIYTDELLFTYLEQFEKDISEVPANVIDATEGGARIRGTTVMPLRDAIDRYCGEPIAPERFAYLQGMKRRDPSRMSAAAAELSKRLGEIEEMSALCEEMLTLLEELAELTHDPKRFNQRLHRIDELRTGVQQMNRAYGIINHHSQLAEFRRFSADRRLDAADVDEPDRARRQIARDVEFVRGIRDGAREMTDLLKDARVRLEEGGAAE